jgi:hypothetical protein
MDVYLEPVPRGLPEGGPLCVCGRNPHGEVLKTLQTQSDAIQWAKAENYTVFVAIVRDTSKGNSKHWWEASPRTAAQPWSPDALDKRREGENANRNASNCFAAHYRSNVKTHNRASNDEYGRAKRCDCQIVSLCTLHLASSIALRCAPTK